MEFYTRRRRPRIRFGYAHALDAADLARQEAVLKAAGCPVVKSDTGETYGALAWVLDLLRVGDTLIVTGLDRLAHSVEPLRHTLRKIVDRGAVLQVLDRIVDIRTPAAVLAICAEFEAALGAAGIPVATSLLPPEPSRSPRGRKPSLDIPEIRRLHAEGIGPTDIAARLGVGRASVYRALESVEEPAGT